VGLNSKLEAEGVSVGGHNSKMVVKSSYHLQPHRLPRLDDKVALAGRCDSKMVFKSSYTCTRAGYPGWMLKGPHNFKMVFKTSYHFQLCRLAKFNADGASIGGQDCKMASKSSYHLQPCRLPKLDAEGA